MSNISESKKILRAPGCQAANGRKVLRVLDVCDVKLSAKSSPRLRRPHFTSMTDPKSLSIKYSIQTKPVFE